MVQGKARKILAALRAYCAHHLCQLIGSILVGSLKLQAQSLRACQAGELACVEICLSACLHAPNFAEL